MQLGGYMTSSIPDFCPLGCGRPRAPLFMNASTNGHIRALRGLFVVLAASALAPCMRSQIFVSSSNGFDTLGTIGEYNLNGSAINSRLVTNLYAPGGIA